MGTDLDELLKSLRVWDLPELPHFDARDAPPDPRDLFTAWFADAVAAGQVEPHTMSLATADTDGLPDVRIVVLHGVDERGWLFASHSTSRKGRQLAALPYAALAFYWPSRARQVRVRGHVRTLNAQEARADLGARSTGALAAALVGRQSESLTTYAELERASATAWERAAAEPNAPVPSWTLYALDPGEVEFFQGDAERRHVRLRYVREGDAWTRELLWP